VELLFEKSHRKRENVPLDFVRSIMADIKWDNRLIGICGARGTGKTTLLLQYMLNVYHHRPYIPEPPTVAMRNISKN